MNTDSITGALEQAVQTTVAWLPQLLGALIIVIIGDIIARAISKGLRRGLNKANFDSRLHTGQAGSAMQRVIPNPTRLIAQLAYWLLLVGAISLAATVLGIDALNDFIAAVYSYVPQIIAAILIFLVGSGIAAGVTTLVRNTMGDTPTGKMIESVAPVIVIGITMFMILDQLGIANTIVTITYAVLLGTVGLGTALAFGLGGRDVASRMLETGYEKGRENMKQVRADLETGKERAKTKAKQTKRK